MKFTLAVNYMVRCIPETFNKIYANSVIVSSLGSFVLIVERMEWEIYETGNSLWLSSPTIFLSQNMDFAIRDFSFKVPSFDQKDR
ncbi:hypothetical protein CEXT_703211 [Caerostris extrusa]|uniref:Uncharacterized protein n=1 Tax=Caerostris extrusa TaxID=172846 RepID=A0AAV4TKU8_CAEEX|nr:hypothetical protein CEXT_703211 [Caerostris extrusa]